jgi:hypothetical protein
MPWLLMPADSRRLAHAGVIVAAVAGYHRMIQAVVARQFQLGRGVAPSWLRDGPARYSL